MDLHPSERVLFEGRPSWRSILHFYILGLLAAIAGGLIAWLIWDPGIGSGVGVFVLLIILVAGWLQRVGTRYEITNERLRIRRGIIARRMQETRLERIQNVNTRQSILERLLRVGTVDFDTAGSSDYDFAFRGVAHPESVAHDVDRAIREHSAPAQTEAPQTQAPPEA